MLFTLFVEGLVALGRYLSIHLNVNVVISLQSVDLVGRKINAAERSKPFFSSPEPPWQGDTREALDQGEFVLDGTSLLPCKFLGTVTSNLNQQRFASRHWRLTYLIPREKRHP